MNTEETMSTYIIETRVPATDEREAGPWYRAGVNDAPVFAESHQEAQRAIDELRAMGPEHAAAEYRYREATARELVRVIAAGGGVSAVLAEVLDANLDEAERREAEQLRDRS